MPWFREEYGVRMGLYSIYKNQKDIVMLGNSLTEGINWSELLNRNDIANRGISGDVTEGFLKRINCVLDLKPKICFIEGGFNDLNRGFTKETIIKNLTLTIDTLKKHNIKPVLTTIPYVTQKRNMEKPLNDQIKETNKLIYELAEKQNLSIIDLNIRISENGFRKDKYAISDGLHFNANTYLVWGEEVEKAIELFNF